MVDPNGDDRSVNIPKDQLKKGLKMFDEDTKQLSVKFPDIPSFSK